MEEVLYSFLLLGGCSGIGGFNRHKRNRLSFVRLGFFRVIVQEVRFGRGWEEEGGKGSRGDRGGGGDCKIQGLSGTE